MSKPTSGGCGETLGAIVAIIKSVGRTRKNLKARDVELAVVKYFNPRVNLIVPNISWGMFIHECDLLLVTKHGYAYEIEIKVSRADLKKDLEKRHGHKSDKIKKLFFAIPDYMLDVVDFVPEHAGVLSIDQNLRCRMVRDAKVNSEYKFSDADKFQVARLGSMRIWGLKEKIVRLENKEIAITAPNTGNTQVSLDTVEGELIGETSACA